MACFLVTVALVSWAPTSSTRCWSRAISSVFSMICRAASGKTCRVRLNFYSAM